MTPRVHRHDLFTTLPLRKGADLGCWFGVGEVRSVWRIVSFLIFPQRSRKTNLWSLSSSLLATAKA